MKRAIASLIIVLSLDVTAELPPSVVEVLYAITGGTNYVKWMTTDGTIVFHKPFVIFDRAQFRVHCPTNDLSPLHYSIEMKREFTNVSSSTNIVDYMHEAECLLLKSFKGKTFTRKYDGVHYQSSCADIDGMGWDAIFSVTPLLNNSNISYVSKAMFFNPLHREGRFVSCEDFVDASKIVCVSSNATATAVSHRRMETISFCDAYFTSLAFINQKVRCRGVLEKIKDCGSFILRPVEGELRDEEHIVHANKYQKIYIHRCNGDVKTCRCNEDEGYWHGLDGKRVIVEGVLSEPVPDRSMVSNEFMSPDLLDSRITIEGGLSGTSNIVLAEKQSAPHFEYESPCREFKVTVYLASSARYIIHYYSAVLWMAYIDPDRRACITRPFPLYPLLADKKKIGKVWTMLNGLEKHIFPSANNPRHMSLKCSPKRYLQIKNVEIRDPKDALVKSVKDLFHFVYEIRSK